MRLTRLYFCYGAILTSVLWLSIIIIYFSIQQQQITSLHPELGAVKDDPLQPNVMSHSDELIAETSTLPFPDLDRLAIIRSQQDKLLRADGK